MEIWTIFGSLWLSLWVMAVWKTYPAIITLVSNYEGGRIITDYRTIHAVLYLVVMFFLSPFVWQVCFFEEPRKRFIVSYVHSILKGEDK
tara:strand:+ start:1095 stop:1361 length:267 start_codon:yes stop_codon:yes gene_type:complete